MTDARRARSGRPVRADVVRPHRRSRSSRRCSCTSSRRSSRGSSPGRSCSSMARRLRGGRVSHGLARALAAGAPRPRRRGARDARDRPPLGLRARADRGPARRPREDGGDARAPEGDARGRGRLDAPSGARRVDRGGRRLAARERRRAPPRGLGRRPGPRARAPRLRRRASSSSSTRPSEARARSRPRSPSASGASATASGPSRRPRSRSRP